MRHGFSLSKFLQLRLNVFLYQRLGWGIAFFYIVILGRLYFLINRKERSRIEDAVESAFAGIKSKSEVGPRKRNVFRGILYHYYEKMFNAYEKIEGLRAFFEESIEDHCIGKLDNALRRGKGVLFVTGHYGGIEYIPIFLALRRYPISVIARFTTEHLRDRLYSKTKDLGLKIIDASKRNQILGSVIRDLRENRIVFIECDEIEEWKPSQKERILFLGKLVGLDRTINIIQRRTGASVIFGILHRFTLRKYRLVIETYANLESQLLESPSSVGATILKFFERYIYSYPEEWYQWKNYTQIEAISIPGFEVNAAKALLTLRPVFSGVS